MNKFLFTFFLFILSFTGLYSQDFKINILPEERIYERYYADALEHQFSLAKHFESRQWFGNMGTSLPLLDVSYMKYLIQLSAAATVFNTIIKTPGHIQVYTVDYKVDFYADTRITENISGRFIFGHLSAHYSDDGIIELGYYPISYVRDYIGLHSEFCFPEFLAKIYAGGFYNFHNEPALDKKWTIQLGGDAGLKLDHALSLYTAIDLKIKSEVNYATTKSFQIGLRYSSAGNTSIRLAFTHRRGFEERGQLFNQHDVKNSLGIYLDI